MQPPARYVNHSCNANTYVKNFSDVANRDIKKGEEITGNYSNEEVEEIIPRKTVVCKCGSKKCRNAVKMYYGLSFFWHTSHSATLQCWHVFTFSFIPNLPQIEQLLNVTSIVYHHFFYFAEAFSKSFTSIINSRKDVVKLFSVFVKEFLRFEC